MRQLEPRVEPHSDPTERSTRITRVIRVQLMSVQVLIFIFHIGE